MDARRPLQARHDAGDEYLDDDKGLPTTEDGQAYQPKLTERTTSALRLHRRIRLPSEINNAHHSTSTLVPVFAKVSHRLVVDIIYSILGQDELGRRRQSAISSLNKGGEDLEGFKRRLTTKFEVDLAACTLTSESIQPPSYGTTRLEATESLRYTPSPGSSPVRQTLPLLSDEFCSRLGRRSSNNFQSLSVGSAERSPSPHTTMDKPHSISSALLASSDIPHSRAFRASNGRVIAPKRVFYSEHDMRVAAQRHRKDKEHCACTAT